MRCNMGIATTNRSADGATGSGSSRRSQQVLHRYCQYISKNCPYPASQRRPLVTRVTEEARGRNKKSRGGASGLPPVAQG